ncbi:MAG TPA: O-antigen ligase family protein, partial [Chloroflexia bacterium]|nr:O-antigen ligase family protein [Chloroflexia bacterium]
MVGAARDLSVYRQQKRQRRERLAGAVGLIAAAMAFATALVLLTGPLPLALGFAALLGVTVIAQNPRIGLYLLLFNAILLEQWGIVGLDPVTKWFPFYETLSGAYGAGVPVSPVEMVLLVTLAAVVLPRLIRRDGAFERGPLFLPLALFLAFVVGSIAYGVAAPGGAGPFYLNAAWAETRSFFYLGITYVLAVNLIRTQAQLRTFVWLFIVAVGIKSVQGIVRYVYARGNGLRLESIVGHEDVVFFAALVLLLGALLFFGKGFAAVTRRQMWVMAAAVPPLVFTLLVTRRRLGFIVLGVALILMGLVLLRTRRDIFMRLVPVAVLVVVVYTIVFWNNTGALGEPIRAFRSIATPTTERDMLSNAWRDLENLNIAYNIAGSPVTGLGFGRPYAFIVTQPPLDATGFTYWRYIAHNAIYWVWMKMGLVGFMLFWNVIGSAVVLGLVTFRRLRDGYLRSLALLVAGVALMQVFFSYG